MRTHFGILSSSVSLMAQGVGVPGLSRCNACISYDFVVGSQADSCRFYSEATLPEIILPEQPSPTLRSRSPCASWAPSLHRGLVRGSFPAPHHHDPNEMLPQFSNLGHGGLILNRVVVWPPFFLCRSGMVTTGSTFDGPLFILRQLF